METLYSIKDQSFTKKRLQISELWYTYIVWFNLSHEDGDRLPYIFEVHYGTICD